MDEKQLEYKVLQIMEKALVREDLTDRMDEIIASDDVISLLGINSIQALQVIALVEIELDIEFDDEKIDPSIVGAFKEFIKEINRVKNL